ncbi:MAG: SDR family NAD(P)-dependent oxidoreductase [Aureliella sp.]
MTTHDSSQRALAALGRIALAAAAGYAGLEATRALIRQQRWFSFHGKTVLITGGSRGLGLVLARKLAAEGARVAICARDPEKLKRAVRDIQIVAQSRHVLGLPCDVRSSDQVAATVQKVAEAWGDIEVLFNVAGIIQVGPLEAMTIADFENAMQVNCWGALRTVQAVLPGMRKAGWGRIVNIASLGGKRAVPHMLPYAASKFALVGLSQGLRAELKQENIFVTTASPGLMRTGSPRNAIFKGQHRREYAWFAIGDSLPLVSMPAEKAADQILRACRLGKGDVLISNATNIAVYLQAVFPQLTQEILALANRALPKMGGIGTAAAYGYESESPLTRSFLTEWSRQAAERNNEVGLAGDE